MSSSNLAESDVEQAALDHLESLGWQTAYGPDIAPETPDAEREEFTEPVLAARLRSALFQLNSGLPPDALDDAFRRLTQPEGADLEARNRSFHRMLTEGVTVEYRTADGEIRGDQAFAIDFDDPENNDWLAVNQFDQVDGQNRRRPDTVLFVNGLPLGMIEFKHPTDPNATVWTAWGQLQTYKAELPTLMALNEILIVSDGLNARIGTLTAGKEWFKPWRTMDGETEAPETQLEQTVLLNGTCQRARFLRLIRDFIVFESDGSGRLEKKMAGYHQFHAVEQAIAQTLRATEIVREADLAADDRGRYAAGSGHGSAPGDRRIGVVWHTQGSGKSLTMVFYAGLIAREPRMNNPTVVVLGDRNDLDNQLFGTFSRCQDRLGQAPVQAESRADLRNKLNRVSGGVVFTTIQKFFPDSKMDRLPVLSDRTNIVVIADEAHRSQYDFIDGYARHMRDALPNASFVGFTGTPIELRDANTRAVFGDYISVYDIQRSAEDGATVPIYYESRVAELALDEQQKPKIDPDFDQATEGDEIEQKEKLKTRWSQIEAVVGADTRIQQVAEDILEHFDERQTALEGKAMIRLYEPEDLRRPLQPVGENSARAGGSGRRQRGAEGRDDRSGFRPA